MDLIDISPIVLGNSQSSMISNNGAVVVGDVGNTLSAQTFYYANGVSTMIPLFNGGTSMTPADVSDDGTIILCNSYNGVLPFGITHIAGVTRAIDPSNTLFYMNNAVLISGNGRIIAGLGYSDAGSTIVYLYTYDTFTQVLTNHGVINGGDQLIGVTFTGTYVIVGQKILQVTSGVLVLGPQHFYLAGITELSNGSVTIVANRFITGLGYIKTNFAMVVTNFVLAGSNNYNTVVVANSAGIYIGMYVQGPGFSIIGMPQVTSILGNTLTILPAGYSSMLDGTQITFNNLEFTALPTLGGANTQVNGISRDGSTVFGASSLTGNAVTHAFTCNTTTFVITDLGSVNFSDPYTAAKGASNTGNVVVGAGDLSSFSSDYVFSYADAGPIANIGYLGGTNTYLPSISGKCVSGDGTIIVGRSNVAPPPYPPYAHAFITQLTAPFPQLRVAFTFTTLTTWTAANTLEVRTATATALSSSLSPVPLSRVTVWSLATLPLPVVITVSIGLTTSLDDAAILLLAQASSLFGQCSPLNVTFTLTIFGFYGLFSPLNWTKTPNSGAVTQTASLATLVSGNAGHAATTTLALVSSPYACVINFAYAITTVDAALIWDMFGYQLSPLNAFVPLSVPRALTTVGTSTITLALYQAFSWVAQTYDGLSGAATTRLGNFSYSVIVPPTNYPYVRQYRCPLPVLAKPNTSFGGNTITHTTSNTNAFRYVHLVTRRGRSGQPTFVANPASNPLYVLPPRNAF